MKAVLRAVGVGGKKSVASLVEQFNYPALGPGQMYEAMARLVKESGASIRTGSAVQTVEHRKGKVRAIAIANANGRSRAAVGKACFSSMPLDELVLALRPAPGPEVIQAARGLHYRSLLTVNLLLNQPQSVQDTWMYVHDPNVRAARIQFYSNWSPMMVPSESQSIIGLEYFCNEADELWLTADNKLAEIATQDLMRIGIVDPKAVFDSFCVRYAKAYPVYDEDYAMRVATIRQYLATITNLYPIGRYGQFRYNNMDHSILTAYYAVRAMGGENIDPWSVNVEQEYHEEKQPPQPHEHRKETTPWQRFSSRAGQGSSAPC
ncbi:MAG: FAD-dependent oxidoreductase [Planctomycetes bacterium]|nr:FAD-dependent oxidoreductase [Planctomycetota bacterium]